MASFFSRRKTELFLYISILHLFVSTTQSNFLQCPYDNNKCLNDIHCGSSAMSNRAGYFCDSWPFYSGGFAECCNENYEEHICSHALYNKRNQRAFCDFWFVTQSTNKDLKICDCKQNNGKYCISWICAIIPDWNFDNNQLSATMLAKILYDQNVEIHGVNKCGNITVHTDAQDSTSGTIDIDTYCYDKGDFISCVCMRFGNLGQPYEYCDSWVCNKYNHLNGTDEFTKLQHQQYDCETPNSNELTYDASDTGGVDNDGNYSLNPYVSDCTKWNGNVGKLNDNAFAVQQCHCMERNGEVGQDNLFDTAQLNSDADLEGSFCVKWVCDENGMDYRKNEKFLNFWLSSLIWGVCIGFALMIMIYIYMENRDISMSSYLCVQGWFFFIFGSIAAVHGGVASLTFYFMTQLIVLCFVLYRRWTSPERKQYARTTRYDFETYEDTQL